MHSYEQRELVRHNAHVGMTSLHRDPGMASVRDGGDRGDGLLDVISHQRWLIVSVIVFCLVAGAAYLYCTPKRYSSSARLIIERATPRLLSDSQAAVSRADSYLHAQCERIRSAPVLADALLTIHGAGHLQGLKGAAAIETLRGQLTTDVGRMDEIVTVTYKSTNPDEAATIANAVVDAYISRYTAGAQAAVSGVAKILTAERVKREVERRKRLDAIASFDRENENVALAEASADIVTQKLITLSTALTTAELATIDARVTANALSTWASGAKDGLTRVPLGLVMSRDTETLMKEMSNAQLRLSLTLKRSGMSSDHPNVQAETAFIAALRDKLADAGEQALERAREKEHGLRQVWETQRKETLSLRSADKVRMEGELKQTERVIEQLDSRLRDLSVAEHAGGLDVSVMEAAAPAMQPSDPSPTRTMGIAGIVGVIASMGLALVRDRTDQRLRTADEVVSTLGLPILGVVPRIPKQQNTSAYVTSHVLPMSLAAEAYRSVRTALCFGVLGSTSKTVLITSPAPGEGKSTAASNLAISLAQAGHRTVLVEADFRRPTLTKVYPGEGSINQFMAGEVKLDNVIRHTDVENLDVLVCDWPISRASEAVASAEFKAVLGELKQRYQYVLVDSSPVCAVSDSRVLATMCDVTMLVVRARKSSRRLALRAAEDLMGVGARLIGLIVNDVTRSSQRSFTEYGGYYAYASSVSAVPVESRVKSTATPLLPAVV